jgi:hypothetical protein
MRFDGRHFRLELLLEVKLWVLIAVLLLVTATVIITSIGVF